MRAFKAFLLGVLIIVPALFVAQNLDYLLYSAPLKLNLLVVKLESPALPVGLLLLLCLAVGYGLAALLGYLDRRRLKSTIKGLKAKQNLTEGELDSLRNLPITADSPGPSINVPSAMEAQ